MPKITAIIVVKNDPPHLAETLQSIDSFVSEIIIGTIDISQELRNKLSSNNKIQFVSLPPETQFADLVKEDLKKQARGTHILYLDPDEIFPGLSNQQLTTLLKQYDHIFFPRKNIIFGKWIEHSRWWPDYQLRLFKKDSVVWPKALHPVPQPKGNGLELEPKEKNAILHYNYDSIDQYLEKAMRYAKFEARSYIKENKKYLLVDAFKQSTSEFIGRFFEAEGYKDGTHGLVLALLQMFYYFLVYFYFWEKTRYSSGDEKEYVTTTRGFFRRIFLETNFWLVSKNLIGWFAKIKLRLENLLLRIFD